MALLKDEIDQMVDTPQTVGAALVVGAGIAGMQASLDLAKSGIKVYLLDRAAGIGGTMSMLDKTFPTNDCAMCILSPKLVEVGRHPDIELITGAEVEAISGKPGNFTVSIRQHPRFVDLAKCTGCGECASVCPIYLPDEFNGGLAKKKAIYKLYPQAIPNAYAIDKRGMAPCRDACPIHQRAQGFVALIAEGRYSDAYKTILEENPFPSICGRVCNRRCEEACNRNQVDTPVNIMALKRFAADWAFEQTTNEEGRELPIGISLYKPGLDAKKPLTSRRVAVVGSGPAGMTCAYDLARQGCEVVVFEALPVPGGMMRVGVPAFRLPPEVIEREIDAILQTGIDLRLNYRIDDIEGLLGDFEAVFVGIGAHRGVKLPILGNDLPGVLVATDFLRDVSLTQGATTSDNEQAISLDKTKLQILNHRVLVLGGGNVAVDTAMTAVRLGATWVGMTCLEDRKQMPAHDWEIFDAQEEGIELFPARTFKEITNLEGRVSGVRTVRVNFRGFIEGRPDFDEIPGTEEIISADVVIFAIGQQPFSDCLKQVNRQRGGRVQVAPDTLATNIPGIFAGGDAVTGTAFIVDAIEAGHRAARGIQDYLEGTMGLIDWGTGSGVDVARIEAYDVKQRIAAQPSASVPRADFVKRPAVQRMADFDEMFIGLTESQAKIEAARCLRCGICSECNQCFYICQAGAINHTQTEELKEINVGAVILTPGAEVMPGDIRPEYGYGHYPNVVTSMQFERMLSASGPFAGVVKRPSDGRHPKKIAWIQCVGSRDYSCRSDGSKPGEYCSAVCCMYATKEAMIAKEHDPSVEPAIFYMDIRSYGKGFEGYIERAKSELGVRYIRCMISSVKEDPRSRNLSLRYVTYTGADGKRPVVQEEQFDLVVLSVGLRPPEALKELADRLGVQLNEYGFAEVDAFTPTHTSKKGIFVAGTFAAPKDIPESVIEASCAASQVSGLLAQARGTLTSMPEYPPERDISDEKARAGVFICHCGINIGSVVDVPSVVEYARSLPGVVYAEHNLYTCSQDTQERIRQRIIEQGINRIIVSSCTPRTHEPLFQDTLKRAGLNPHLFEMANIREQDAWVHKAVPQSATQKAQQLTAMAVAKSLRLHPIIHSSFNVEHKALVIGGGLAGMKAALSIAQQGFAVYLVERDAQLGGNLRHIYSNLPGEAYPQAVLDEVISSTHLEPSIQVMTSAQLVKMSGYSGQFLATVQKSDGNLVDLACGAIILATGGKELTPSQYLYGQHPQVLTQREFEEHLTEPEFGKGLAGSTVVMIQCVGSREPEHPYCSRICCTQALKNALIIKNQAPEARVVILYRDLRSYGFREKLYRKCRETGVIFLQYSENNKPKVSRRGEKSIRLDVDIQPENETVTFDCDWLVLSAGIEAEPGNPALAQLLKVPLTSDGFFLEAHLKLRPVDFAAEGIYLAGLAHSPRSMEETIVQAEAAAARAVGLISQARLEATPVVASVNPKLCAACGQCVEVCPYGARVLQPGMAYAEVIEVLCQGCGACIAACPNKASQQKGFEFQQVFEMVEAAMKY
jgi:heterodisulfide reductase subunit A-like polyferredoxin